MHPKRKQRLLFLLIILLGLGLAASLALYALRQNINLYYTPSQVIAGQAPAKHSFRLGGLVKQGSVKHAKTGLKLSFIITDLTHDIGVNYEGILPDLFREGQGVVVQGQLTVAGELQASEVLAKHDEKYTPPIVAEALKSSKRSV